MTRADVAPGWLLSIASGAMLGASYYLPWLVFNLVALLPILYVLDRLAAQPLHSIWPQLRVAWLAGFVMHAIGTSFLLALTRFSYWAILLYPALTLLLGLKVGLILTVAATLRRRLQISWVAVLPICWVAFDFLLSFGDLRLTADHLYHTMTPYPLLLQLADLLGPYGITYLVVSFNALLFDLWNSRGRAQSTALRPALSLLLLAIVVLGYGFWARSAERTVDRTLRVGIVQPNVEMLMKWDENENQRQWEKLVRLTKEAAAEGAELVVWPETAYPFPLNHWLDNPDSFALPAVERLAAELDISILSGIEYRRVRASKDFDLYNAMMVITPDGLSGVWGAKKYLVPFTEKLPFRGLFGPFIEGRGGAWRWLAGGFEEGKTSSPLEGEQSSIGALVCYEQLFSDLFREQVQAGAGWFAVITNDAWFARTPFQQLQANAVRLRAIESRRDIVRAANTGISAFATADGSLYDQTELYEEAVLVREISIRSGQTFYTKTGDVVAWASLAILALLLFLSRRRSR